MSQPEIAIRITAENEAREALKQLQADLRGAYQEVQQYGRMTEATRQKWVEARKELLEHQRVQRSLSLAWREQYQGLYRVAGIMSEVGSITGRMSNLYTSYNAAMIRVNQLARDQRDLQEKVAFYTKEVADAQERYNDAVKKFGEDSPEAQKAADDLREAKERLWKATKDLKDVTEDLTTAQGQNRLMMVDWGIDMVATAARLIYVGEKIAAIIGTGELVGGGLLALPIAAAIAGLALAQWTTDLEKEAGKFEENVIKRLNAFSAWGEEMPKTVEEWKKAYGIIMEDTLKIIGQTERDLRALGSTFRDEARNARQYFKDLSDGLDKNKIAWANWGDFTKEELRELREEAKRLRDALVGQSIFPDMMRDIISVTRIGMDEVHKSFGDSIKGIEIDLSTATQRMATTWEQGMTTIAAASVITPAAPTTPTPTPSTPAPKPAAEWVSPATGTLTREQQEAWLAAFTEQARKYLAQYGMPGYKSSTGEIFWSGAKPPDISRWIEAFMASGMDTEEFRIINPNTYFAIVSLMGGGTWYDPWLKYMGRPPAEIFPTAQAGGIIAKSGLIYAHAGEEIIPQPRVEHHSPITVGPVNINIFGRKAGDEQEIINLVERGLQQAIRRMYG